MGGRNCSKPSPMPWHPRPCLPYNTWRNILTRARPAPNCLNGTIMSKRRIFEIHQDDELAQIDEELDRALEQLETANVTVGELLGEMETVSGLEAGTESPPSTEEKIEQTAESNESGALEEPQSTQIPHETQ
jgi:hypothetical protein